MTPHSIPRLRATIEAIAPLDATAMTAAQHRLDSLTKPRGSLGRVEQLVVQLAGITGDAAPTVRPRAVIVAAADHGVAVHGVSAYPQAVTTEMVRNFLAGGAAVNVLAKQHETDVFVVSAGLASRVEAPASPHATLVATPFRGPTADIAEGPAMTRADATAAIERGLDLAAEVIAHGARLVAIGEMGIGNTTVASAIVAAMLALDAAAVTGRGTGLADEQLARKIDVVRSTLRVNADAIASRDPVDVLAAVGGRDIAVLVGVILATAAANVPLLLDGFITGAAALVAARLCPALPRRLIASHRSPEPGHAHVLDALRLEPLLDLELRLGEGSGALLALPLIDAACALRDGMATFDSAGVSDRARETVS